MIIQVLSVKSPIWSLIRTSTPSTRQLIWNSARPASCVGYKHFDYNLSQFTNNRSSKSQFPILLTNINLVKAGSSRFIHCSNSRLSDEKYDWDVDINVPRSTLVYSNNADTKMYKLLPFMGFVMFIVMTNLASLPYNARSVASEKELKEKVDDSQWFYRMVIKQHKYKHIWAGVCGFIGTLMMGCCILYPGRVVRSLTLLKGGQKLRIETYSFFNKKRKLTVPIHHASCYVARATEGKALDKQLALKVKNYQANFMINQKEGVFHEPRIFDLGIGVKRRL